MLIHELSSAIQRDRERTVRQALVAHRRLAETDRPPGRAFRIAARLRASFRVGVPQACDGRRGVSIER